jgi:hypothetical protein
MRQSARPQRTDHRVPRLRRAAPAAIMLAACSMVRAHAETPAATCARLGTDDLQRPIPATLVPAINAVFGTNMPVGVAVAATVFRCLDGRMLVCTTGANLPCGPANTSRTPGTGANAWCRDHPDTAFIPAVATGHDTIFVWRCQDGAARVVRQVQTVDARGFIAQYWKELPK